MTENLIIGAIGGDIIGSTREFHPIKITNFPLFEPTSRFTDDTVMTIAVAQWLANGGDLVSIIQNYGRKYPHAGYGGFFREWLKSTTPLPYNSYGNGSAMRVSFIGWAFDSIKETLDMAKRSAEITHNHPEGIKGAQAVAACIYWARNGKTKEEIKQLVESFFDYDLSRSCEQIRAHYKFDETCQGSVPEAIIAFLESKDYVSAVRLAISLGGDADTQGAITGGIAEAYYKEIPDSVRKEITRRLSPDFISVLRTFNTNCKAD